MIYKTIPTVLRCATIGVLIMLLSGCATKGTIREFHIGEVQPQIEDVKEQLVTNTKMDAERQKQLGSELEEIKNEIKTMNSRFSEMDTHFVDWENKMRAIESSIQESLISIANTRKEAEENIAEIRTVNEQITNLWKDLAKLEKNFNDLADTMKTKIDEHSLAVQSLESNLATQKNDLENQINKTNKNLSERLETTNQDLNVFRNQMVSKFVVLQDSLDKLGTSVYEIVKLQRKQFEDVVKQYDDSMRKIEILLPERTISEPQEAAPSYQEKNE